jgi:hypothetical protein
MSTTTRFTKLKTCLNAVAATGAGSAIPVQEYRHIVLQVGSANSANLTVKFQGSLSDDAPNFDGAQTVANHWDYVQVIDLQDSGVIAGDTGLVLTGTDDFRNFLVNVDGLQHLNAEVTAYAAGNLTVNVRPYTNI